VGKSKAGGNAVTYLYFSKTLFISGTLTITGSSFLHSFFFFGFSFSSESESDSFFFSSFLHFLGDYYLHFFLSESSESESLFFLQARLPVKSAWTTAAGTENDGAVTVAVKFVAVAGAATTNESPLI
jgi:hypothetical protein